MQHEDSAEECLEKLFCYLAVNTVILLSDCTEHITIKTPIRSTAEEYAKYFDKSFVSIGTVTTTTTTKQTTTTTTTTSKQTTTATVNISVSKAEAEIGGTFSIDISLSGVPSTAIKGCEFALKYDSSVLNITDVKAGEITNTGALSHFAIGSMPDFKLLALCVLFTLIFASIAAKIANKADAKVLNRVVGVILLILGVLMIYVKLF